MRRVTRVDSEKGYVIADIILPGHLNDSCLQLDGSTKSFLTSNMAKNLVCVWHPRQERASRGTLLSQAWLDHHLNLEYSLQSLLIPQFS